MPASVIAAYAASWVAGAVVTTAFTVGLTGLAYAATYYATQFIVASTLGNAIRSLYSGGGGAAAQPVSQQVEARKQMIRSPTAERQTIYGEVQVSGALVFAASSADNSTLHLIIAHAGHEVQEIAEYYLNDKLATDPLFSGLVVLTAHLGAADQVADANLVAANVGWTAAHRLQGIAYTYAKLTFSQDAFPTGIPTIKCKIKGKKLYDPRTGLTVYSNNSGLVARDYLSSRFKAISAEIDEASFIAAANICDESIALAAGGTEARYTANGVIIGMRHRDAMHSIMSSCGGALTAPQGLYRLSVAAYTAPVIEFNEDILRGPIRTRPTVSKKDLFNAVKGQFVSPANYWQASDFPPVKNSTYAANDGEELYVDLQLPFTTSSPTAQRLARIALEKSRQGVTVEMPCKLAAIQVRPFSNITLTIANFGWTSKVFKVMKTSLSETGGVDLVLQEEASACYDWSAEETIYDLAPNSNLPDPFTVGTPGDVQMSETLYETTGSVGVRSKATLTWTAPDDAFIVDYEVEYKLHSSDVWIEIFNVRGTQYEFYDLAPDAYDFRVKAQNVMGVVGSYTTLKSFTVYGLTAAPAAVTGFSIKAMAGLALATWNRTTDLDVKIGGDVVLRWSPVTVGATWGGSVILPDGEMNGDAMSAIVPLATGTYFAKFKDSTGHYSDSAASFVATEALVSGWTTVATSTQHSAFTGAKTNVALDDDAQAIKLDGSTLVDDMGMFDDLSYLDSLGGIAASGTYEFDAVMDLSTVAARRFHAHIRAEAYDTDDLVDLRLALLDAWEDIDGEVGNDCDATVYASVSDDGATYSDWTPFMVADFDCRYAKFRALLLSGSSTHNIQVSELSVTAKILT